MEAFLSAEAKISQATSLMRRNCWSRAGGIVGMVGIIKNDGRRSLVAVLRSLLVAGSFCEQGLADPIFDS